MTANLNKIDDIYNYGGVVMTVTPEQARFWLSRGAAFQRKISEKRVSEWLHVMRKGEWRMTHQGVAITKEGEIVDGQHRLNALAKFDKPLSLVVTLNADPSTFDVLDRGYVRSAVQIIRMGRGDADNKKIACLNTLLWTPESEFTLTKTFDVKDLSEMYSYFSEQLDLIYPKNTPNFNAAYIRGAFLRAAISSPSLSEKIKRMIEVLNSGRPAGEHEFAALTLRDRLASTNKSSSTRGYRHQGYRLVTHSIRLFCQGTSLAYKGNLGRSEQSNWLELYPTFLDGSTQYESFSNILNRKSREKSSGSKS